MWAGESGWEDPDRRDTIRDCFVTGDWGGDGDEDEGFGDFEVSFDFLCLGRIASTGLFFLDSVCLSQLLIKILTEMPHYFLSLLNY